MDQRAVTILAALAFVLAPVPRVGAQCSYDVTIIQGLDCGLLGSPVTDGLDINDNAHIVGSSSCLIDDDTPWLWTAEQGLIALPVPVGATEAVATGLNDSDEIVGWKEVPGVGFRAFVHGRGGYTELPPARVGWSSAAAINESGVVVGTRSILKEVDPQSAFIWSAEGGFVDLGLLGSSRSRGVGINDRLQVIGYVGSLFYDDQAFLWERGAVTWLGLVPGGTTSAPWAVNSTGQVVGAGRVQIDGHVALRAFTWFDGTFTVLPTVEGCQSCAALDINDVGQVVGVCTSLDDPNVRRAVLWLGTNAIDLDALASGPPWMTLERARAINNSGRIVAHGSVGSDIVSFLLTPVARAVADVSGDCAVGSDDLELLLANWGSTDRLFDVDGDGSVGFADLVSVLIAWSL